MGIVLANNLISKEDENLPEDAKKYKKTSKILLLIAAVGGGLIVLPEFITTIIGLLIGLTVYMLAIVRKKPDSLKIKPVKHVVGEVVVQDIDCEADDITL